MLVSLHKSSFFTDLSALEYSWATFSRSHLFYGLNRKSGDYVLNPSCYVLLFWYISLLNLFLLLIFCLSSCLTFLVLAASFIASVWCLFTYLLRLACCPFCVCLFKGCDVCCSCITILILSETLVNGPNTDIILRKLNFECTEIVHPVNHMGGLWALWSNTNITANVLLKNDRAIHLLVQDNTARKNVIISGVYAPAQ